jgi:hypothetical protein
VVLTAAGLAAAAAVPAAGAVRCAGPADRAAGLAAAAWVAAQPPAAMAAGQQADAIVALRAAGRSRASLAPRLRRLAGVAPAYARTAGAAGKVVLAAVAAGADPRALGGVDYTARIRRAYADGRYGASAYDQALSMIALRAAGRPVPPAAVRALRAARGPGGWGFALRPGERDQADATGYVLRALGAAGVTRRDPAVAGAVAWLLAQRDARGGLASAGGRRPAEANSTAAAWRGLCAVGAPVPASLRARLRGFRDRDGALRLSDAAAGSRLLATVEAVPALLGQGARPSG